GDEPGSLLRAAPRTCGVSELQPDREPTRCVAGRTADRVRRPSYRRPGFHMGAFARFPDGPRPAGNRWHSGVEPASLLVARRPIAWILREWKTQAHRSLRRTAAGVGRCAGRARRSMEPGWSDCLRSDRRRTLVSRTGRR